MVILVILHWMGTILYGGLGQWPFWLIGLCYLFSWLPWIAVVVVLTFRFVKGRTVRVGFYLLGTITPTAVVIGLFLFSVM